MNGNLLRNLAEPLAGTDAATVNYVNSKGSSAISSSYDLIGNSGALASVDTDGSLKVYHGTQANLIVNDVSGIDTSRTKSYWENANALPIVIQTDTTKLELNQTALMANKPIRYDSVSQTFAGADNAELLTKNTINT